MNHLQGLNKRQKEAVLTTNGPLLILAGAGAGKTKTITHRILHLIKEGVNPSNILAVTFTNKAAKEMRGRLEKLIEEDKDLNLPISFIEKPFVSTFHSLGVHILKENSAIFGIPRHFNIFDRNDSVKAVKEAIINSNLDPKQFEPTRLLSAISKQKGQGVTLEEFRENYSDNYANKLILGIWEKYDRQLKDEKAFDFDDLLLKTTVLLKTNKEIRERYQKTWTYIHIDEYQDTNRSQYDTAKLLAGENKNICVVGDIDQSIYSWRGADFKNIMRFEKDYPNTKTILLEENYRSTKTILSAANTIIAKNTLRKDKNLFTSNDSGDKIVLHSAWNEEDEAGYIAKEADKIIKSGTLPDEIAVLYRANFQSRAIEEAFLNVGVPYQVLGTKFFERKEIKDILSYIKAALNPESLTDLKRIINTPARGIGKTTVLKIFGGQGGVIPPATAQKIANFWDLLKKIKEKIENDKTSEVIALIAVESGMKSSFEEDKTTEDEEKLQNIYELASVAKKYDFLPGTEGIERLLTDAALASDQDELEEKRTGVKLMTVHASKGLEFDYVFITGLEEDIFPHTRPDGGKKNIEEEEEERRLFYVALTRARKKVFLSNAATRTIFGSKKISIPSRFIADINSDLIEESGEAKGSNSSFGGKVIYLE